MKRALPIVHATGTATPGYRSIALSGLNALVEGIHEAEMRERCDFIAQEGGLASRLLGVLTTM